MTTCGPGRESLVGGGLPSLLGACRAASELTLRVLVLRRHQEGGARLRGHWGGRNPWEPHLLMVRTLRLPALTCTLAACQVHKLQGGVHLPQGARGHLPESMPGGPRGHGRALPPPGGRRPRSRPAGLCGR